jgi:hypothetical protein
MPVFPIVITQNLSLFNYIPSGWLKFSNSPHGILRVFNTILYENEFQNPQIFCTTLRLFHEQSTLGEILNYFKFVYIIIWLMPAPSMFSSQG